MSDDSSKTIQISREHAAALGHETVAILKAGYYETGTGAPIDRRGKALTRAQGKLNHAQVALR